MPVLLLIRHGRTRSNTAGILAGWTPGVGLDDVGVQQVAELATRLADLPVCRVVTSPLQRTVETAQPIAAARGLGIVEDADLGECHYGAWTGRKLSELAKEPLWRAVQSAPATVTFPAGPDDPGESLRTMATRSVMAIQRQDALVAAEHGPHAVWVAVSHGDVIKAIVGDAMGAHFDHFQRVQVDPASVSVLMLTEGRPMILGVNGTGADLARLVAAREDGTVGEGTVGGGAGPVEEAAVGLPAAGDDGLGSTS